MRNWLTVAALVVFAVSTGLLEMVQSTNPPTTDLPPAIAVFEPPAGEPAPLAVDGIVTSGIGR